jgi:hypothetical protein
MNDCHCHKDDTWHPEGHANATCEPSGTQQIDRGQQRAAKKKCFVYGLRSSTR